MYINNGGKIMSLLSGLSGLKGSDTYSLGRKQEVSEDASTTTSNATSAYMGPNIGNILNGSSSQPSSTASAVRF